MTRWITPRFAMLSRKYKNVGRPALRTVFIGSLLLLSGCNLRNAPVLSADGPIAGTERDLLFVAVGLMLIVVVPVFVMAAYFAWHYRASNTRARYMPEWSSSIAIEMVMWLVPIAIVGVLSAMVYIYSHRLDPYRPLASNKPPLRVEAISLDWKWVFIYPKQHIATVNELIVPTGRPVRMKLTSDTVMNSFYIPGLVGQIYTMAGMQTRLNMLAHKPAHFIGRNTNFSGRDFADQHFAVKAVSAAGFRAWIARAKRSQKALGAAAYARLERPGTHSAVTYSTVEPNLFYKVIAKYSPSAAKRAEHTPSPAKPVGKQNGEPRTSPPKKSFIGT
jgi:cytochrome o ubiquinol oxidase subunit II